MNQINIEIRRQSSTQPFTYSELDRHQREIAQEVRKGSPGSLLLSELSPVITRGRRTPSKDVLLSPEILKQLGIEEFLADRGGFATYHGPGQWVLFPVERLEVLTGDTRGVRKAVEALLEIGLEIGKKYRPDAHIREGKEMGVWSSRGKFAAVGVHVEQGVLLHGLSVNGHKTPTSFLGLKPCGLDLPVDFLLEKERGSGIENSQAQDTAFQLLGKQLIEFAVKTFWKTDLDQSEDQLKNFSEGRLTPGVVKAIKSLISFIGA